MVHTFSRIRDQEYVISTLRRALASDRVHHAYLFKGPPGVGKELTALAFAMALNCRVLPAEGCGQCADCRRICAAGYPDVRKLTPEEGKRQIRVDDVREVENWLRQRPHEGKARVLIITPAEAMNEAAANAMLKTLEEPRQGNHVVLVTSSASSLLPTVRSRCQMVRFRALEPQTIVRLLMAKDPDMNSEHATLIAALSEGSMEKAVGLSGEEMKTGFSLLGSLMEGMTGRTPEAAMNVAASMRDRNEAITLLELLLQVMEEQLLDRCVHQGLGTDVTTHLRDRCGIRKDQWFGSGWISADTACIAAIHRSIERMKRNNMNPQLAIENVIFQMRSRSLNDDWSRIAK